MNQSFLLKYYGKLSIFEQESMTGEERKWWIKRLNDEIEKQNKANRPSGKTSNIPGSPPI